MIKTNSRQFIVQSAELPIDQITGSCQIPAATFKGCIIIFGVVLDVNDNADNAGDFILAAGAIAAGCSVNQYIGIVSALGKKDNGYFTALEGGADVGIYAIETDTNFTFDLSGGFVPNRFYIAYLQWS